MADPGRYTVHGPHEVHGHKPGETFTADIPAQQEALLIGSGSLVREDPLQALSRALSRDELDALAEDSGVPDPGGLDNKDAVIAAINDTREEEVR